MGTSRTWPVAALVAVGLIGSVGAGCGGADGAENSPSDHEIAQLATRYAPILSIHPKERWLPISPDEFVDRSTLRWLDGDCADRAIAVGAAVRRKAAELPRLDPARLGANGSAPYRVTARSSPDCRGDGAAFTSVDYTRPYDALRHNDIDPSAGFVLDLDDPARLGAVVEPGKDGAQATGAAAYYESRLERVDGGPGLRIDYWTLFRMDRRDGDSGYALQTAHEGDWVRVSVLLGADGGESWRPISLRLQESGELRRDVTWKVVARDAYAASPGAPATHPLVLLARGTHTLFEEPGRHESKLTGSDGEVVIHDDASACPDCIAWRTWRQLRLARSQPWWGYGGAWGDSPSPSLAPAGLGPSRWTDVKPGQLQ